LDKQFWNLWSTYALTYFGKVNLSIVMAALLLVYTDWSMYYVGFVASGFFASYAIGQFLNGQISERFNPYIYITAGLCLSGLANLFMGFLGGFLVALIVLETCDGFFQSMNWSSIVRATAELYDDGKERSRRSTILGTSYQFGSSLTFLVSAFSVATWGWQAGFYVASAVLIIRGVLLFITKPKRDFKPKQKIEQQVKLTLSQPVILSGLSLLFLNMVRYGVLTWFFVYLVQQSGISVPEFFGKDLVALALVPVAGICGTLVYNKLPWKKDLISIFFLFLMGVMWLIFPFVSGITSIIVLLLSSAFLYGPHVFLVSTIPTRLKQHSIVASSTGFIDGMGYVGTFLIGLIVPYLVLETGGWSNVFLFWACISFLAMISISVVYFKHFKEYSL